MPKTPILAMDWSRQVAVQGAYGHWNDPSSDQNFARGHWNDPSGGQNVADGRWKNPSDGQIFAGGHRQEAGRCLNASRTAIGWTRAGTPNFAGGRRQEVGRYLNASRTAIGWTQAGAPNFHGQATASTRQVPLSLALRRW